MYTLTLADLRAALSEPTPPQLVEALPERYFLDGHLPGAVRINVGEVTQKAEIALPDRHQRVVVYCASATCSNSDQVAAQLLQMGYAGVGVFKGGKAEWLAAGLSLERSAS